MTRYTAAIDLGGTHVRAAVVASDGTIVAQTRRATPTDAPRPNALPALVAEVAGDTELGCAVVGIPGIIDHEDEALVQAPNLPERWAEWLTGSWLESQLGVPVSLANDADLAAVGEAYFGAGRRHRDMAYVTISTGVGAGMVTDRRLVRGRMSGAEIGHTVIDRRALAAGEPATVEELGSGPAISRAAAAAGLTEREGALADLVRSGDPTARAVWASAIEAVAVGVVNVAWLITPQVVVVGGGVGVNNGDLVFGVIDDLLRRHGPPLPDPIAVVGASLGDDAALTGAAAWFEAIGRPLSAPVTTSARAGATHG